MPFSTRRRFDWQLRTRTLSLGERTRLMAIVNLTPDSFSGDGLAGAGLDAAVKAVLTHLDEGADIVDLGGESTRPGAQAMSAEQEQARLLPVLEAVLHERPGALLSVDTYHSETALAAAHAGAEIINDVSGLTWDSRMAAAVARTGCGLVLMHTRGRPQEWRLQPPMAAAEVLPEVFTGLRERAALAEAAGIPSERIVLDPGFGFGKRGAENLTLLADLDRLHPLGRPLLIGLSRKGFLGEAAGHVARVPAAPAESRRAAGLAAHTATILAGAHILRVHDLQITREAAALADALLEAST